MAADGDMMVRRAAALLAPFALLSAVSGCGGDDGEPAREPARTQLVRVYDNKAEKLTDLRFRLPIAKGWSGAGKPEFKTAVGGTGLTIDERCELLVQFQTGNTDKPIDLPFTREVEQGARAVKLDGVKLEAEFGLRRAERGLVFGGGATGPGGALTLVFRDAATRKVVARLIALGGMDGSKCPFSGEEAIRRTFAVLRDTARRTTLERVPS